jgi:hypothetical protein
VKVSNVLMNIYLIVYLLQSPMPYLDAHLTSPLSAGSAHLPTNSPIRCLIRAERTGSLVVS